MNSIIASKRYLVGLIAQLVEHRTGIAETRVRILGSGLNFSGFLAAAYAVLECDDQIHSIRQY